MGIFLFLNSLIASGALCVAVLLAIRSHRLRMTDSTAAVEYVWAAVPWVFVALCAVPALHRMLMGG
ncbi:MAG: hypothetical protein JO208_03945 [Alphaproteobacteria bacterium]|nr:hypothetical protein [Alphaproteobacteria bacterium]